MFKDAKERSDARTHLPTLKDHPAWKFVERALNENIAHFQQQLRTRKDFAHLEEVFFFQDRISDIEAFKNLPETLLAAAQEEPEEAEEEEIYDTPAPDEEK